MARGRTLRAAREHTRLVAKWGAVRVDGLDQHRAEAIGLQPLVKKIGYATNTQELPPCLRSQGDAARYIRRTAELLLQNCVVWKEIEINCRETNAYYKEQLTVAQETLREAEEALASLAVKPSHPAERPSPGRWKAPGPCRMSRCQPPRYSSPCAPRCVPMPCRLPSAHAPT